MRLDKKIDLLSVLPVFEAFEPEAVHVLAFSADERSLRPGETLFGKGAPSDGGFLVLEGRIGLSPTEGGIGDATIAGPGVLIGETALFAETERPGTAFAVEPSVVLVLPRGLVHRVLENHPRSASVLRRRVATTLASTEFALRTLLD